MNNRYEHVYDVGLLDDLHNYFPRILYEPERILSVQDLLSYIRTNAISRFNLYEQGRNSYNRSRQIPRNTMQTPQRQAQTMPVMATWMDPLFSDEMSLFSILRSIAVAAPRAPAAPNNFQDIIVHASQELLNSSSTTRQLLLDLEERCSICQDRMIVGDVIRKLNACHHEFHGDCVDNWFLHRSVLCPVCRHDIRDSEVRRSPLITANSGVIPPPL